MISQAQYSAVWPFIWYGTTKTLMGHKQTLCADTWLQKVHFCVCLHHWSSSKLLLTHGARLWLPESALFCVIAPLILFKTACDMWCRDMVSRKCTFECVCTTDPLQNYSWHMVQGYGSQKVHFSMCLHHWSSSELLVTNGAGIWLPESALFRVFAPWALSRTTCDTW